MPTEKYFNDALKEVYGSIVRNFPELKGDIDHVHFWVCDSNSHRVPNDKHPITFSNNQFTPDAFKATAYTTIQMLSSYIIKTYVKLEEDQGVSVYLKTEDKAVEKLLWLLSGATNTARILEEYNKKSSWNID